MALHIPLCDRGYDFLGRASPWIPAFAGMTENGTFSPVVIPAKAGIQEKQDFFNGLLTQEEDWCYRRIDSRGRIPFQTRK